MNNADITTSGIKKMIAFKKMATINPQDLWMPYYLGGKVLVIVIKPFK